MTLREKIGTALTYGGLLTVMVGVLIPLLTGPEALTYKIVYTVGAVATLVGRILMPTPASLPLRARRLLRMQMWSAVFFCASAGFMFYSTNPRDWLAFTLAGAAIQIYVSLMLPRALKKG